MIDLPKYDGPRMVPLLNGDLVWNDSEEHRHECEARDIAAMPLVERNVWLAEIELKRGAEAAARLRKTVDEVIAVTASGARR
jgi:hypothetical protein